MCMHVADNDNTAPITRRVNLFARAANVPTNELSNDTKRCSFPNNEKSSNASCLQMLMQGSRIDERAICYR